MTEKLLESSKEEEKKEEVKDTKTEKKTKDSELKLAQNDLDKLLLFIKQSLQDETDGKVILLPVDSSPNSLYAVEYASKNHIRKQDVVILMTVWEELIDWVGIYSTANLSTHYPSPVIINTLGDTLKRQNKINEKQRETAKKLIMNLYSKYLKDKKVLPLLIHGPPDINTKYIGQQICKIADKSKCNLIIMGSRGLGKIKEFFLGSVSTYVLHNTDCPVLLVKH